MLESCTGHDILNIKGGNSDVTITEASTDNVLAPLLKCGNTATMNALSPRTLYSFYPTLTLQGKALMGQRWVNSYKESLERFAEQGINTTSDTQDWETPCGYSACPAIARRVEGLRSIGVMVWNRNGFEGKDLTEWSMAWGINRVCWNGECENYGLMGWEKPL